MEDNEQTNSSTEAVVHTQAESTSEETKFVPATAYKEVSSDMHKYKSGLKDEKARTSQLEAELAAIKENQMKEQQRFEELWKGEKAEREKEAAARVNERELYVRSVKMSALKDALGGKVKDEYLSFADVKSIEMTDDGTLNSETVQNVANSFRQDHPSLIAKDSSVNITGTAPANGVDTQQVEKTLDNMSTEQKIAELTKRKQNRS